MNETRLYQTLRTLLETPSPVGYYPLIDRTLEEMLLPYGYEVLYDHRHTAYVKVKGENSSYTKMFGAHFDEIGLIVKSIEENGWLAVRNLGGINFSSLEGENCVVFCRNGKSYSGNVICKSHSVHAFDDARDKSRDEFSMFVKLDEDVTSKEEVRLLGVRNGDPIAIDPKYVENETRTVKARHLDDKAACAVLIELLMELAEEHIVPATDCWFAFPINEEIGLGGAFVPERVDEYVALDIGLIAPGLDGNAHSVSICAADRKTPYDYDRVNHLIDLCEKNDIPYALDVFYHYGSDASAAMTTGMNIVPVLFGPAVISSHGYEIANKDTIENTYRLTKLLVLDPDTPDCDIKK